MLGVADPAARRTVECLTTLDALEGFRALPAEILVELTGSLCRLTCGEGETVIWEGSNNADVFILISGRLDVLMTRGQSEQRVGAVRPGEVFGEMSFITGERRSATVRAAADSECFVLRAADLRIFIVKEPLILVQMAKVLARRLRKLDEAVLNDRQGPSVG
jgi:CRP-like cAMP-binding protein